jgi:Cu(I)/Ag(I) efflux system membrane fusion protein
VVVTAIVAVVAVALLAWAVLIRKPRPDVPEQDLGPVHAAVWSDPAAPRTGENRMTVQLTDPAGRPVRGAEVEAIVFMAQMGSMPYMESRMHGRETGPGLYVGSYSPSMGGRWEVDLRVKLADGRRTQGTYSLTVGRPGIAFAGSESPAGKTAASDSTGSPPSGTVRLDEGRRQEIGVTTARLEPRDLTYERRTTGTVAYDERRQVEVAVKVTGWIRDLRADFEGAAVPRGQVLFTLYSPELYAAQQEYASALDGVDHAAPGAAREWAADLARAARQRLLLWDVPASTVNRVERTRRALEAVPVLSPASGIVTEKRVVEGSQVMPGMPVLRIASTNPIWVQAQVYPHEVTALAVGQRARVRIPEGGGAMAEGRIAFIDPEVDPENRTARARIELANPRGLLKPGMFVDVELLVPIGLRLAVPVSAVLRTGTRDVVFVDAGGGRLEPHDVRLGRKAGDFYEVLAGLREGDQIVTSGTFLVGAESRLRTTVGGTESRP